MRKDNATFLKIKDDLIDLTYIMDEVRACECRIRTLIDSEGATTEELYVEAEKASLALDKAEVTAAKIFCTSSADSDMSGANAIVRKLIGEVKSIVSKIKLIAATV